MLDYASDLAALDAVRFGALIEKHSGHDGIDRIEDFADWYRQEHPGESEFLLDRPRMVLVGLGVDDRARRVVNFLAESQVDIQLMTFYAFREAGKLFLARQIESPKPSDDGVPPLKERNLRALHDTAKSLGVDKRLCCNFGQVLAPFAVDQAACLRADGEQRVDSSASSDSVGWTVTDTCTTATKIRRVRPPAVKMSRNAKRWLTRPACIAGVLVSRPNLNARCGRMKL